MRLPSESILKEDKNQTILGLKLNKGYTSMFTCYKNQTILGLKSYTTYTAYTTKIKIRLY